MLNPSAMRLGEAARYIGMSKNWLAEAPIDKADMRKPGAPRAVWRWRKLDLDCFVESRLVRVGHTNRMAV